MKDWCTVLRSRSVVEHLCSGCVDALTRGYAAKADSLLMHSEPGREVFCSSMSEGEPGLICESFSDGIAKSTTR